MRTAFIETLSGMAEENESLWLITGDLGYSVLEHFAQRFPRRFINAGVAEQNMIGIATGLALSGKIVFVYSIANFPIMRCLEQIRNDVCYHNANVKIIAVGGGFAYGVHGYTHHGLEDLAVLNALPKMTIFAPGDPIETREVTRALVSINGPCYLRLGKAREAVIHKVDPDFEVGKSIKMRSGQDGTLMCTGGTLELALEAALALEELGYSLEVLSFPTIKPLDAEAIIYAGQKTKRILTIEEHGWGGLGTIVAEVLAINALAVQFCPLRVSDSVIEGVGSQNWFRSQYDLSSQAIVEAFTKFW